MRTIVNSTYVTLDGVIEDPQDWPSLGSFSDAGNRIQAELLERCDAVLMGRHTYDGFAPVWSAMSGDPFSDRMNSIPKYVVDNTCRPAVAQHQRHRPRPDRDHPGPQAAARRRHRAVRLWPVGPRAHVGRSARRAAPVGAPLLHRHRHGQRSALPGGTSASSDLAGRPASTVGSSSSPTGPRPADGRVSGGLPAS